MAITLIYKKDYIAAVPDRWRNQYGYGNWLRDAEKQNIQRQLDALTDDACEENVINAIIGNNRWTVFACDECRSDVPVLVRIGDEPDYEVRCVDVCHDCLQSAVEKLDAEQI